MAIFSKEPEKKVEKKKSEIDEIFDWLEELDQRLTKAEDLLSRVAGRMGIDG